MRRRTIFWAVLAFVVITLAVSQLPAVKERLLWGYIQAEAWTRGALNPAGEIPTPLPTATGLPTATSPASAAPRFTPENPPTAIPTRALPTPTPLPASVYMQPPEW